MATNRRIAILLGIAAFAATACRVDKACRPDTVLVNYHLPEGTPLPASLAVAVQLESGIKVSTVSVTKQDGALEVDFPSGYPTGQSITVAVSIFGSGEPSVNVTKAVAQGCTVLDVQLQHSMADGGSNDLTVIDAEHPDATSLADLMNADLLMQPVLTGLTASAGSLSPAFDASVTEYELTLKLSAQTLTLTPTADAGVTITVNGNAVTSGTASSQIPLNLGETDISVVVSSLGGMRTYVVKAIRGGAIDYMKASNTGAMDQFGISVALSGDTLAVGAPAEDSSTTGINTTPNENAADSGAVYVFVRSGTVWTQQAYVKASNAGAGDYFGQSVALDGDTLVVGAPLEASSTTGINTTPNESASASGAAYVFVRSGATWSEQAYVKAGNSGMGDLFGTSVSISGDTLAVGASHEGSSTKGINTTPNESASHAGAAYVFVRSGTTWSQQAYIKASNSDVDDEFGCSVAVAGNTLAVGAFGENSSTAGVNTTSNEGALHSGAAYVYVRSGSTWSEQAYLKPSNTGAGDHFGNSVALSGETLAVGAPFEDSATLGVNSTPDEGAHDSGAVYVFLRSGSTWAQQAYIKPNNTGADDWFGFNVALAGDWLAAGSQFEDGSSSGVNQASNEDLSSSGAAYLFTRNGATWTQKLYVKAANPDSNDAFGSGIAVSGDTLAVGSINESGSGTGINPASDNTKVGSGAVYVY